MKKTPMTITGAEKLKVELHRLKTSERPRIIQAIAEARAHGDLSENAEYHAAKEQQGFVEGRIAELDMKLATAQVIDPKTVNAGGRVVFGATLRGAPRAKRGDATVANVAGCRQFGVPVIFDLSEAAGMSRAQGPRAKRGDATVANAARRRQRAFRCDDALLEADA